jgi:hypothetical protein
MTPPLRKLALMAHVVSSIGWLGAVGGFLVLAIVGLTNPDGQVVRAVYLAMEPLTWFAIVPLAIASLLTGLILSFGTPWGLFKYYWVLVKLLINTLSIPILLRHTRIIGEVAVAAAKAGFSGADLRWPRVQLVVTAAAALFALLVATALSVYKPRGTTL